MTTQMSEPVRKFLEKPNFAVLATRSNGELQATPMWYVYEDGQLVLNSSKGRAKLRYMHKHPEVALAIVDRENPYQYVQIRGKVTAFDEKNGARDIDRLSHRYNGKPYPYPGGDSPDKRVTIRITPTRITTQGF